MSKDSNSKEKYSPYYSFIFRNSADKHEIYSNEIETQSCTLSHHTHIEEKYDTRCS